MGQNFQALLECKRENKALREHILTLQEQIRSLTPEPKPTIKRITIDLGDVTNELSKLGLTTLYGRLDSEYFYTTLEDWGKVLDWIYVNCEMPEYFVDAEGKWNLDCEDFALWLKAMVSVHFGLNYFSFILGDMPTGRHAFNLLRAEDGCYLWEPNPGFEIEEPMPIKNNQHSYVALYNLV